MQIFLVFGSGLIVGFGVTFAALRMNLSASFRLARQASSDLEKSRQCLSDAETKLARSMRYLTDAEATLAKAIALAASAQKHND